jgi:hypothetical protein
MPLFDPEAPFVDTSWLALFGKRDYSLSHAVGDTKHLR